MKKVYFDHNSTTPLIPEVLETLIESHKHFYGNPSSLHHSGIESERVIKNSRRTLAKHVGVEDTEIIFTSGATESINVGIKGATKARKRYGKRIITSQAEHEAVLNTLNSLKDDGFDIIYLTPDKYGCIDPKQLKEALTDDTILVSIMHVNNELGTINPINKLAKTAKRQNPDVLFFSDGAQAFGKIKINLDNIDMYSISGHKCHAPKGIGALIVKKGLHLKPLLHGGNQENKLRPGTENTESIAALAKATELAYRYIDKHYKYIQKLKSLFLKGISTIADVHINSPQEAIPSTLNIAFPGIKGEVLLHKLEQYHIYVSTGSACSSKNKGISHVLKAINLSKEVAESSIRISFSHTNTEEEINYALSIFKKIIPELRDTL